MHFTVACIKKKRQVGPVYSRAENCLSNGGIFDRKLIYNLRNLNLKYVDFESKSSKTGEKVIGFSKNSFDHPRGDMDLKPFRGARYGSRLLALAGWASWVKCAQSYRV